MDWTNMDGRCMSRTDFACSVVVALAIGLSYCKGLGELYKFEELNRSFRSRLGF